MSGPGTEDADHETPTNPSLARGPGGSFVLGAPVDDDTTTGPAVPTRRRRASERALEEVGGPIHPQPTIYFGRPPGTENRRAGAAALVGAGALLVAAWAPWAVRRPDRLDPTNLGWRDANGALGPGWVVLLLCGAALGLAVAALSGRTEPWMRWADLGVGGLALLVAVVEGVRILQAGSTAEDISDGTASVDPGWGLGVVVVGAAALGVAALVHRSQAPAWRRT